MNEYYLGQLAYLDIKREEYLAYLFVGRLSLFGILLLLGCTWLGIPALLLATGWYGFSLGYLFVDALVGMGLKGMLLVVASLFPQAFAYVPGCLWMAKGMMENGNNPLRFLGVHSVPRTVRIRRLLVAGLFLLAGVWLEGTINPIVLKNFIRRLL